MIKKGSEKGRNDGGIRPERRGNNDGKLAFSPLHPVLVINFGNPLEHWIDILCSRVSMRLVVMKCGPTRIAAAPALGQPC
jgi:hypothetical protein